MTQGPLSRSAEDRYPIHGLGSEATCAQIAFNIVPSRSCLINCELLPKDTEGERIPQFQPV
jgi:hypothetical protein